MGPWSSSVAAIEFCRTLRKTNENRNPQSVVRRLAREQIVPGLRSELRFFVNEFNSKYDLKEPNMKIVL